VIAGDVVVMQEGEGIRLVKGQIGGGSQDTSSSAALEQGDLRNGSYATLFIYYLLSFFSQYFQQL